jgi:hypothetical protein
MRQGIARRPHLVGKDANSAAENAERLADAIERKDSVVSYTAATGTNTVRHRQGGLPQGRHLVYDTAGVTDVSLTADTWTFTAAADGEVRVIWIL